VGPELFILEPRFDWLNILDSIEAGTVPFIEGAANLSLEIRYVRFSCDKQWFGFFSVMRIRSANCTWINNSAVNRIPCAQNCGSGFTDPDPAFQVDPDTDPDPIRIQGFDDQKVKKKNTAEIVLYLFSIKNCNLLMSKQQEKPSALEKVSIQHFKKLNLLTFFYVFGSFSPSWVRILIANPDTDPGTRLNPDPDPQHCLHQYLCLVFSKCRL
jgi:hypothetical protein